MMAKKWIKGKMRPSGGVQLPGEFVDDGRDFFIGFAEEGQLPPLAAKLIKEGRMSIDMPPVTWWFDSEGNPINAIVDKPTARARS